MTKLNNFFKDAKNLIHDLSTQQANDELGWTFQNFEVRQESW
jgi:hypothetical protein